MSTTPQQPTYIIPSPAGANWKTPLAIIAIVLLAASNIYLYTEIQRIKTDSKNELAKINTNITNNLAQLRLESTEAGQRSKRTIDTLQSQIRAERRLADRAVGDAKVDAQKRLETLQTQMASAQTEQQKALDAVKVTADTTTTKLANVSTTVDNQKTQLDQTIASLKHVSGDVDNHASLIATNGKELDALRQLGERNYSEFTLNRSKQPSRVGDIMVLLKKADLKRNRFTIEITADDKKVEKRDRTVNEPIQFYTSKARQPYEIVVNSVKKDAIAGYLSIPKVLNGRAGS